MVIKLYISGISGNKEVKKKQQRVQMILDSKQINYEAIDITEPGKEKDKEFMQQNGKVRESLGKYPLPPQIFNDEDFCGDYEDFDMANEVDELEKFLHIETSSKDNETDTKILKKMEAALLEDVDVQLITELLENSPPQNEETSNISDLKQPSINSLHNPYDYYTFKIKFDSVNGLKEQIVNSDDFAEEKAQTEDIIKSEVNGESKAEPTLELSSKNLIENVKSSAEVDPSEKEESPAQQNQNNDKSDKKEDEENIDDTLENKVKGEGTENEDKTECVENPIEEKVENSSEKKEEIVSDDNKDEEEIENESEEESPQSEKSQKE